MINMLSRDNLQQQWHALEFALIERLQIKSGMDSILLFIGIREAGLPPKEFTENEKINLRQMAVCTILVAAGYYQLLWVDDFGWPNFKQLQREPEMRSVERENFLKPWVLLYIEKNKLV